MRNLQSKLGAWALSFLTAFATLNPGSVVAATGVSTLLLGTTGCGVTPAQIQADGKALDEALLSIANVYTLTNPTAAANLVAAANALLAITQNWQTGSSIALFNDAANVVEVALAAIPQTAVFAPLVPIAVAALDILVANVNPTGSSAVTLHTMASPQGNPYRGKATIHHRIGRSLEGDFKAAWNKTVEENKLAMATLK
jgi:hypothetical protein